MMKSLLLNLALLVALFVLHSCKDDTGSPNTNNNGTDSNASPSKYIALVPIAPGTFTMGHPDFPYTQCQCTLTKGFWMARHEVTQKLWKELMGSIPAAETLGDSLPIANIQFYDMVEFCNRLSAKDGLTLAYTIVNDTLVEWSRSANGYRLPTEAEWEYACKSGSTTDTYNGDITVPDGPDPVIDAIAWYGSNSGGTKHPVGLKKPSPWGLYDMLGNVGEAVWDKGKKKYDSLPKTDPVQDDWGRNDGIRVRMSKGSPYKAVPKDCYPASGSGIVYNDRNEPDATTTSIGFRVVRNK